VYQNPPRAASSTRQHVYIAHAPVVLLPRRNAALNAFARGAQRMSQDIEILPVFISSTSLDLRPEREAVRDAVLRIKETQFVGMEYFGSRDETTQQASLDEVDRSRVYVCIVAGRYGSGITEAEYERARENDLPCFVYFKDDSTVADKWHETEPEQAAKLAAFKQKLRDAHTVTEFDSPADLAFKLTADLHRHVFDDYVTPKLRGALRGELSREEAQTLLGAVKDLSALSRDLVTKLQSAGFNLAVGRDFIGRDNITNIYTNAPAPTVSAPVIPTLHQLRAPVGDFVGREKEIDELLTTLRGGASAAISGISGMGGIGKTELAFYVAERLRDVYTDAQLVVDMGGTNDKPRDPEDALAACIRAFVGPEQRLPDDLQELTRIYRNTLDGKRALILLDNAYDGAQARPLLPPAGSALLVTSRNAVTLPRMKHVMLEQLEPSEARELLREIAPRVPPDTADHICFLCGYLPLAIRAAGSLLDVTRDLAPNVYAEQLQDERRRLELIGAEGVDLGVEASFGLSYARLTPDAARVFRRLAVFPASFDARAEETVCEDPGHKHLSELLRRNLVRYNEETQRYSLHDLARLFADSRMSDDERHATRMRHAEHYLMVLGECNALYLKGGDAIKSGLALFDVEWRNIEAGQRWACLHSSRDKVGTWLCNKYPAVGASVLMLRQHPREGILWLEAALVAARQLKDRRAEGGHLSNLGGAYANLGETRRAIEYVEQTLAITREIGDRSIEGKALGNLGYAYNELGEHRRAIGFYEQQLTITRELGDRRDEVHALSNLGVAYKNLGEMRRAVEFYEQALIVSREVGERRGEGAILGNLGNAYAKLGEMHRAVEFQEQCLVISREIGDRRGEGNALFNTGLALNRLGDRAKAIAHVEAALEIYEQIESPNAKSARAQLARWRGDE
jgi:tetratricopeptide (TPR) repeat protein